MLCCVVFGFCAVFGFDSWWWLGRCRAMRILVLCWFHRITPQFRFCMRNTHTHTHTLSLSLSLSFFFFFFHFDSCFTRLRITLTASQSIVVLSLSPFPPPFFLPCFSRCFLLCFLSHTVVGMRLLDTSLLPHRNPLGHDHDAPGSSPYCGDLCVHLQNLLCREVWWHNLHRLTRVLENSVRKGDDLYQVQIIPPLCCVSFCACLFGGQRIALTNQYLRFTHTHTCTHAHTYTCTHVHTHTHSLSLSLSCVCVCVCALAGRGLCWKCR